jgi:hypothetical protein
VLSNVNDGYNEDHPRPSSRPPVSAP